MNLIPKEYHKVSNWSGGTTTELFIFPANATVSEQNFDYRISTAQVRVEKSEFTLFPGYHRKLAILEGKLNIQHNQEAQYVLKEGDQTSFEGNYLTCGEGQVVDFNVIYKDEYTVEIRFINDLQESVFMEGNELIGFYCVNGSVQWDEKKMSTGDFITFSTKPKKIIPTADAILISVIINKL